MSGTSASSSSTLALGCCPCCGRSGDEAEPAAANPQTGRAKIKVMEAMRANALPAAIDTVYENRSNGRWPWLTRVGPHGRRSRDLWIVVSEASSWWIDDGRPAVAARLVSLAAEGGSR